MFTRSWCTSDRKYGVLFERDVPIFMSDGIRLDWRRKNRVSGLHY